MLRHPCIRQSRTLVGAVCLFACLVTRDSDALMVCHGLTEISSASHSSFCRFSRTHGRMYAAFFALHDRRGAPPAARRGRGALLDDYFWVSFLRVLLPSFCLFCGRRSSFLLSMTPFSRVWCGVFRCATAYIQHKHQSCSRDSAAAPCLTPRCRAMMDSLVYLPLANNVPDSEVDRYSTSRYLLVSRGYRPPHTPPRLY